MKALKRYQALHCRAREVKNKCWIEFLLTVQALMLLGYFSSQLDIIKGNSYCDTVHGVATTPKCFFLRAARHNLNRTTDTFIKPYAHEHQIKCKNFHADGIT